MQSALVSGRGSSIPDGDKRGEDGPTDGSVKVHPHLCQVDCLLQEVHLTYWDSAFATFCALEIK